jgi:hypothetical protein
MHYTSNSDGVRGATSSFATDRSNLAGRNARETEDGLDDMEAIEKGLRKMKVDGHDHDHVSGQTGEQWKGNGVAYTGKSSRSVAPVETEGPQPMEDPTEKAMKALHEYSMTNNTGHLK